MLLFHMLAVKWVGIIVIKFQIIAHWNIFIFSVLVVQLIIHVFVHAFSYAYIIYTAV